MSLPQLEEMPKFTLNVKHPSDTPILANNNFSYRPWQSTNKGKNRISKKELLDHTHQALAWLKSRNGSSPFGFIFSDGTYDLYPSNECLGLVNAKQRICRDKPVQYFIGCSRYSSLKNNRMGKAVDWLLNRSPYAPVFVTKDAQEAVEKGVILNTKRCVAITVAALRSFYGMVEGQYENWAKWARYVPEDIAWPFCHYLHIYDDVATFSDEYDWSSTMGKNIGIDGIKRFATHDYSLHDTVPMRDKPFRYEDFSHLWRTRDKKVYVPFKPTTETKVVKKVNKFNNKTYEQPYDNAIPGKTLEEVAANLLNYIGWPYE